MTIIEQIEKLIKDIDVLVEDMQGTDLEYFDKKQLRVLSDKSKGLSCEAREYIHFMSDLGIE